MLLLQALVLSCIVAFTDAVDRTNFRTCAQTGFCHRFRQPLEPDATPVTRPVQTLKNLELSSSSKQLKFALIDPKGQSLTASIQAFEDHTIRFRVVETEPYNNHHRWEPQDLLTPEEDLSQCTFHRQDEHKYDVQCPDHVARRSIVIQESPFQLQVVLEDTVALIINDQNLFHFQHQQPPSDQTKSDKKLQDDTDQDIHQGKKIVDYGEDGLAIYEDGTTQPKAEALEEDAHDDEATEWEEHFGSHTDKKQYGPTSLGLDISFPQCEHLYGIPEHASDFSLKNTRKHPEEAYDEPFRLYNLDVFEYELDVSMALYGSIPFLVGHSLQHTVGLFWNNPSETFIDIDQAPGSIPYKRTHWLSESGVVDVFVFTGPTLPSIANEYTKLTGRPMLPPLFSIAYHQCRWNYKNELDVERVHAGFEHDNIPLDVIWLDIEHTDGKRYFTWDDQQFPTPVKMQEKISSYGRKMVTIVDPHIKRDPNYPVHQLAQQENVYVKSEDGQTDFDGWCWPGSSSYVDFTSPRARKWWAERFHYDKYLGSTKDLYTWNDMNEPSVFNGPEVSMRKSVKNLEGIEHREWHNLYGRYMQQATMEGQLVRQKTTSNVHRAFVLSRAFAAGSQKYGAIWTGDNEATWESLEYATKMLLSMNIAGLVFVGADVGGFFGNPDPELLIRWYQAATFQPFFRAHAHHDAKRREPYLPTFTAQERALIRQSIVNRYAILPYLYTVFAEAHITGNPIMRALWVEFPSDPNTFAIDTAYLAGADLYVAPVSRPGATTTTLYLPHKSSWYDYWNYARFEGGKEHLVASPLNTTPVFQRGGSILTKRERVRRSSVAMQKDPYTLVVALAHGTARGKVYLDDEVTTNHATLQEYQIRELEYVKNVLSCKASSFGEATNQVYQSQTLVERILVLGVDKAPTQVHVNNQNLRFQYDAAKQVVIVKKPNVGIGNDWEITFDFNES